jgi:glycosyltransferase involved in cell wall biosynthesis
MTTPADVAVAILGAVAQVDIAVVGQDPRFGGGFRTQAEAFWRAAEALGRSPHLYYLSRADATSVLRPGVALAPREESHGFLRGTAFPSLLPEVDGFNQVAGGIRMGSAVRGARSVWVNAASAPYGYAAVRSGRPYACWIGTSLADEWRVRRPHLPRSRRLALRVNAPALLRLEREVLRRAVAVYATTPYSRETVAAAAGLDPEQVGILPIPIEVQVEEPEPEDVWLSRLDRPTLVFVGRASDPRKNLPMLLDAFRRVRERLPGATLRLVGEPPGPELTIPDGVDVLGNVDEVASRLRTATLFVLPSLQEGFGIVAAEALAAGVPVVSTPSGGPTELLRASGGGRLVEGFGAEEFAGAIVALLEQPDQLREMRRRGRDYVVREHSPARLRELVAEAFARLDAGG